MKIAAETVAELNARKDLSGYGAPAPLEAVLAVGQPVLALLITSHNGPGDTDPTGFKVLTGVRKPEHTYPFALSVATGEISQTDAQTILDESLSFAISTGPVHLSKVPAGEQRELSTHRQVVNTYRGHPQPVSLEPSADDSRLVCVTRDLLNRKYAAGERAVELGLTRTIGTVSLHDVAVGLVGADGEGIEYNPFLDVVVSVPRALIQSETDGYSSNAWVDPEQFLAGYESRDPNVINPELSGISEVFVCTRGQCLRGAAEALQDPDSLAGHLQAF